MDIVAEMELHDDIFDGGVGKPAEVFVTVRQDWFRIRKLRNSKPSVSQVEKYWSWLKRPCDSFLVHSQLHMIKRSMLEWPKMGAAIAKLAQKEFLQAKKEEQLQKRR